MTGPKYHYERALVPEFLTRQTIETIPLDEPYYISPGERDDHTEAAVFMLPDRSLVMPRSYCIDMDDKDPGYIAGKVGVMRIALIDNLRGEVRTAYVADLRFIEDNALVDKDTNAKIIETPDGIMNTVHDALDTVTFEAFIASEQGADLEDGLLPATYYGNPVFYPHLDVLREQSDLFFARFLHDIDQTDDEPSEAADTAALQEQPETEPMPHALPDIDYPFMTPRISD